MNKYRRSKKQNRFYAENKINRILKNIEKDIRFENNLDKNLSFLEELLKQPYFHTRIYSTIAEIYYCKGQIQESLDLLDKTYKNSHDFDTLYKLNKILFGIGEIDTVQSYINNIDDSTKSNLLKGFVNKYCENYEQAIQNWLCLRYTYLEDNANFELATLYHSLNDNEKAKYYYEKLLKTPYKNRSLIRLIEIALQNNDPNIENLFHQTQDIEFYNKRDFEAYSRCRNYYKYKNGTLTKQDIQSYYAKQLYDYNIDMAIDHIYNHHVISKSISYRILPDIDLDQLYTDVKNNLVKLVRRDTSDIYEVELEYDIGEMLGFTTNKVRVATIPYTDKILTMYPIVNLKYHKRKQKGMK